MSDGLKDIYFSMDDAHRRLFKEEGEKAAGQIEIIIRTGKSVAVKVLEVIRRWLMLVPGLNRFFLEKEAKIKTDKILRDLRQEK